MFEKLLYRWHRLRSESDYHEPVAKILGLADAANRAYKKGNFREASRLYESAIREVPEYSSFKESVVPHYVKLAKITAKLGRITRDSKMRESELLDKTVKSIIGVAGLLAGIFFLSTNLTGNVIGSLN